MKLYVVGIGPGNWEEMTPRARKALEASDVIVGYTVYIDLIKALFEDKRILTTPMKQEVERCRIAINEALKGQTVSVLGSGDAGVYGLAGVIYEMAESTELEIEVIPGITAACSAAAVLGAPLVHDFCSISLSDLLTPWEKIEKRLKMAGQGDFVICLYNPSSKKRFDYLRKACDLLLEIKGADTPCGYVRYIGRSGQEKTICTLSELRERQVDMFTTVIIGNSETQILKNNLVTPRGYLKDGTS